MNKTDLIEKLVVELEKKTIKSNQKKPKIAKKMVDIFFNSIQSSLEKGEKVEIRGLGTFSMKHYTSYMGRNPKTGDPVSVSPKQLPTFKAGKDLKKMINHS